ncbi:hypothetical protein FQZ97_1200200 [compost metagenome]
MVLGVRLEAVVLNAAGKVVTLLFTLYLVVTEVVGLAAVAHTSPYSVMGCVPFAPILPFRRAELCVTASEPSVFIAGWLMSNVFTFSTFPKWVA